MDAADAIIPDHPNKDRNKVSGLQGDCEEQLKWQSLLRLLLSNYAFCDNTFKNNDTCK